MLKIKRSGNGRFCTIAGPEMNQQFIFKIDKLLSDNVKGCEYSQKYKLGLWDGKFHLFRWYEDSNVGYFPAGALPDVISLIKLHNYQFEFENITVATEKCDFQWKSNKQLYDYQKTIINDVMVSYGGNAVIEMPTGSGKTLSALAYVTMVNLPFIVLVHRAELLHQWKKEISEILGEEPVIIGDSASMKKCIAEIKRDHKAKLAEINEQRVNDGLKKLKLSEYPLELPEVIDTVEKAEEAFKTARCCVAMVQTLHSWVKDRNRKHLRTINFPVMIVDECHVTPADTVYDVVYKSNCKFCLGMSATVGRNDGREKYITSIIGPVIKSIDISTLVDRGILAKPEFRLLIPNIPYGYTYKFAYYDKPTYATVYRDCIVGNIARNEMIAWQAKKLMAEGRQVYIHVSQIDHGEILNSMIPDSVVVFGTTKERRQIIEDYTNGKIRCLISTLLKEGVNIPSIDGLIYAAGGKSEISTIQTIGRAMRKKDDGRNAIVVDIHDTVECYLSEHSQQREMTYIKVYGKLYNPTYIKQLEMEDELGMKINV